MGHKAGEGGREEEREEGREGGREGGGEGGRESQAHGGFRLMLHLPPVVPLKAVLAATIGTSGTNMSDNSTQITHLVTL